MRFIKNWRDNARRDTDDVRAVKNLANSGRTRVHRRLGITVAEMLKGKLAACFVEYT